MCFEQICVTLFTKIFFFTLCLSYTVTLHLILIIQTNFVFATRVANFIKLRFTMPPVIIQKSFNSKSNYFSKHKIIKNSNLFFFSQHHEVIFFFYFERSKERMELKHKRKKINSLHSWLKTETLKWIKF